MERTAPRLFTNFNRKSYTLTEIYNILEQEGIEILETHGKRSFFFTVDGVPFIVHPKKLRGLELKFVLLHETQHYLASIGNDIQQAYFYNLSNDDDEMHANLFALICLIPITALNSYDWLEENPTPYARKLWDERLQVKFLYRI